MRVGKVPEGKQSISEYCGAYVMHGGMVDEISQQIRDMKERRLKVSSTPFQSFGMAAYVICRDTEEEALEELNRITQLKQSSAYAGYKDFTSKSQLEQQVEMLDYSVSNRGLRPNLIGTPNQIAVKMIAYEEVGLDLLLLQCSPHLEEMERFSKQVMPLVEEKRVQERKETQQ